MGEKQDEPSDFGTPLMKFYSDEEEEEEEDNYDGLELIGLLELGHGKCAIEEGQEKLFGQFGLEHGKVEQKCKIADAEMPENPSTSSPVQSSFCPSMANLVTVEHMHKEWVQHQLNRIKLKEKDGIRTVNDTEKSQKSTQTGTTLEQFWSPLKWREQADEVKSSALASSSSKLTLSSNSYTNNFSPFFATNASALAGGHEQEIQRLRSEVDRLGEQNRLVMDQNTCLCHNQSLLLYMLNQKQLETDALNIALAHLHKHQSGTRHSMDPEHVNACSTVPMPFQFQPANASQAIKEEEHFHPPKIARQRTSLVAKRRLLAISNYWNKDDCNSGLEICSKGTGVSKNGLYYALDFATVRAKFPIKLFGSGFYYFEVNCLERKNRLWIGLSTRELSLHNSLGHSQGWGYANFGCFFDCGRAKAYGEEFDKGDVIGCALHLAIGELFFTKNRKNLGVATKLSLTAGIELFPTVSMSADGAKIDANFGQSHFLYDMAKHLTNSDSEERKENADPAKGPEAKSMAD